MSDTEENQKGDYEKNHSATDETEASNQTTSLEGTETVDTPAEIHLFREDNIFDLTEQDQQKQNDMITTAVMSVRRRPRRAASKRSFTDLNTSIIDDMITDLNGSTDPVSSATRRRKNKKKKGDNTEDDDDEAYFEPEHEESSDNENLEEEISKDINIEFELESSVVVDQEDIEEEKPKKKRGRKPKNAQDKKKTSVTAKPRKANKCRLVRSTKDLSAARDKIERIYGINTDKLLQLAKIKEGFELCLFDFPKQYVQEDSPYYLKIKPACLDYNIFKELIAPRKTKYQIIDKIEFDSKSNLRADPLNVIIGKTQSDLNTGDRIDFPLFENYSRDGFIYNTGGLVTDMAWLTTVTEDTTRTKQTLAVSLSEIIDDPSNSKLEILESESHISYIEIYEIDSETLSFDKRQTIVHNFGDTWNLKWHEGCADESILGSLGFVSQDGAVRFINIENNTKNYEIRKIYETPLTISLNDTSITCFDFLSPNAIICGFKNGYVGEFELTDSTNTPSFYKQIHDSYIISIVTASSAYENTTVTTIGIDGYIQMFDPKDIYSTRCILPRLRGNNVAPIAYSPQLFAMIFSDSANSIRGVSPRAIFAPHQINSRNSTVTSLASSRLHPLLLSGTADGNLYIDNIARRFLTGVKNVGDVHKSLKLWKWDYNLQTKQYRLDENYEVFKCLSNDVSKTRIDPHGINISAVKWNETSEGCKIYAFSNNAGLLTIERLPM